MLMQGLGKPAAVYSSTAAEVMSVEIYILPSPRLIDLWSLCSCHRAQQGPSQKSQIVKKNGAEKEDEEKTDKD